MITKKFTVSSMNEDTKKTEPVGEVEVPLFDEENSEIGLKEIASYDWSSVTYADGVNAGYKSWADAVVKLVNTQHGTNLRNRMRQSKSGKVSAQMIEANAMATCTVQELQAAVGDPAKFLALKETKIAEYKKKLEAEKAQRLAAAGSTPPAPNGSAAAAESADAASAADAQAQGQGQ
jgi:hypothetical protein